MILRALIFLVLWNSTNEGLLKESESNIDDTQSELPESKNTPKATKEMSSKELKMFVKAYKSMPFSDEFSCCIGELGVKTREILMFKVEVTDCNSNFCGTCEDDLEMDFCQVFRDVKHACNFESIYSNFMIRHCLSTCGWCKPNVANTDLRIVQGYYNPFADKNSVLFSYTATQTLSFPWIQLQSDTVRGEIDSFYLYEKPNVLFDLPIYICQVCSNDLVIGVVSRVRCGSAIKTEKVLYAASERSDRTLQLQVASLRRPPWTSRVYIGKPCCGYTGWKWSLLAPKISSTRDTLVRIPYHTSEETTRMILNTTSARFTKGQTVTTLRPTTHNNYLKSMSSRPTGSFIGTRSIVLLHNRSARSDLSATINSTIAGVAINTMISYSESSHEKTIGATKAPLIMTTDEQNCLSSHNLYRNLHGVPPLTWDEDLASSARSWANFLATHSPNNVPNFVTQDATSRYPHSSINGTYRNRTVGESINWSVITSSKPEVNLSLLFLYSEVFGYNLNFPSFQRNNRTIGNFTQMVWRSSSRVGCAFAVRCIEGIVAPLKVIQWTVIHYKPGKEPTGLPATADEYKRNVPKLNNGSCSTKEKCSNDGTTYCLGFNKTIMNCSCEIDQFNPLCLTPICVGNGGCFAYCRRPSKPTAFVSGLLLIYWKEICQGQTSCECISSLQPHNPMRIGAYCT